MFHKVWDVQIHLYHTQTRILVGVVRYSVMEKQCLVKVCLLQRDRDLGPSYRKGNCIKLHILQTWKSCLGLHIIVLEVLYPSLLIFNSVPARSCHWHKRYTSRTCLLEIYEAGKMLTSVSRTSYVGGGKVYWEAWRGTMGAFVMITMYFLKVKKRS